LRAIFKREEKQKKGAQRQFNASGNTSVFRLDNEPTLRAPLPQALAPTNEIK
jgi:hypothetical protein